MSSIRDSKTPISDEDMQVALVLRVLNRDAFVKFCYDRNYSMASVPYVALDTPEKVISCLSILIDHDIWPGYLFNNPSVWKVYLYSITEEKYHKPLNLLLHAGQPDDLIMYLRACYKFGFQVITDEEYDALESLYLKTYPNISYLNNLTNDDSGYSSIVQDAIKFSIPKSTVKSVRVASGEGSYASLNSEKSTSVKPVRSYKEAYEFLLNAPRCRTHWSLKQDGFNTKLLFKEDGTGLDVALSRGRATDSWDYTEAIKRVLTIQGVDVSKLKGKVTGESLVSAELLETLRLKYPDKDYKSPKSTAGAMLRAPQQFDESDYKYLRFIPFEVDEMMKDKAFSFLKDAGFELPPYRVIEENSIPLNTLEEFSSWLDSNILNPLWEEGGCKQEESDGVVLQLLTNIENDRADKYSDLNIALKFSHWSESEYTSIVKRIIFEQQRVLMSVVLEVEPVTTRDFNVATRVSAGSSAILVNDRVKVGDKIRFVRKSESVNIYEGKC